LVAGSDQVKTNWEAQGSGVIVRNEVVLNIRNVGWPIRDISPALDMV
jgi:hypothetical protein